MYFVADKFLFVLPRLLNFRGLEYRDFNALGLLVWHDPCFVSHVPSFMLGIVIFDVTHLCLKGASIFCLEYSETLGLAIKCL